MDKTLVKGLEVLEFVSRQPDSSRLIDIAAALGITKSNAHRTLETLQSLGYVQKHPQTRCYAPTLRTWELGMAVFDRLDVRPLASENLRELSRRSRETVHLAVLDGAEVVYIDKVESPEPVKAYTRVGGRAPAHCVATGKALLSTLPDDELAPLLRDLARHSPNTITDRGQLGHNLAEVRRTGFAVNRGEWRESVWGLAAPICRLNGKALAAVGVSGPEFRIAEAGRLESLAAMVLETAASISRRL